MAPVAMLFARSAIATFPPASRSPMMPDPMTAANRKAVPSPSATARRTTALLRSRFHGADESAHEFVLDQGRDGIHVDTFATQELARVLDAIDASGLDVDAVESGLSQLGRIFANLQRTR